MRQTAIQVYHAPLVGTFVFLSKWENYLKNKPSFAKAYKILGWLMKLVKAAAVIPKNAQR